jgi:zinc protease
VTAAPPADLSVLDTRPEAGRPRAYHFPPFERSRLRNGAGLIVSDLPGRPLVTVRVVLEGGAASEPMTHGGVSILTSQSITEGTERFTAIELIEALERLGADLGAEAGWDSFGVVLTLPARRLEAGLELLAEVLTRPTFPEREVDRLREERLADLMQARADPRRLAELSFGPAIYPPGSPFARPVGGLEETVARIDQDAVAERYARIRDPRLATVVVAGDLAGIDILGTLDHLCGDWRAPDGPAAEVPWPEVADPLERTFIRLMDRPGSVQSEIRIGHVGVPRRIPDFYPTIVMSAALGGLFRSRLQMKLREEKGYTYGASATFEFRRSPGPFAARSAVRTDATAPALVDAMAELRRIRDEALTPEEIDTARDYLVGVFPLRFETPGAIAGALSGLVVQRLPDDELERYRPSVAAVTAEQARAAAEEHIHPDRTAIVVVGDAARVEDELRATGIGDVDVVRESAAAATT